MGNCLYGSRDDSKYARESYVDADLKQPISSDESRNSRNSVVKTNEVQKQEKVTISSAVPLPLTIMSNKAVFGAGNVRKDFPIFTFL